MPFEGYAFSMLFGDDLEKYKKDGENSKNHRLMKNHSAECDSFEIGKKNSTMEKIKEKLHVPKGNNPRSPDVRRLSAILRDSMYLAWPAASFSEDNSSEAKKRLFRQSATMVGDDEDEDYE